MTITAPSTETIQIKTKDATITLGQEIKVGDFTLTGPGEYEIAGVEVRGVGPIYLIETEEMLLAYLDHLNRPLKDDEHELVSDADVLFIPVGGGDVLDAKAALPIIAQIDPRIVIPINYDEIDTFSKNEGVTPEFVDSLKLARTNLPETERKVYVLPWKSSKK